MAEWSNDTAEISAGHLSFLIAAVLASVPAHCLPSLCCYVFTRTRSIETSKRQWQMLVTVPELKLADACVLAKH